MHMKKPLIYKGFFGAQFWCRMGRDARLFLSYLRSRQRYCYGIARRKCNLPLRCENGGPGA
jgi:hypothetical protein